MSETDLHKVVDLDRGLFLISYKSAEDLDRPPRVEVAPAPGHEKRMELVLHPDAREAVLWQPNSSLVVRVNSPGQLQVQVLPASPGASRNAMVRVEPLQPGRPRPATSGAAASTELTTGAATSKLKVLGHVAGIGDVVVGPDTWIAGPTAPSRIEGISLEWPDMPSGLGIQYAVQLANAGPGTGKMMPIGSFAGTRGRALPLTGVVFEMSGREDLEFVAEAVFLNSPTLRAVGKRVVLSGPSGREPLVGLRITLEPIGAAVVAETASPASPSPAATAPQAVPRPASSGRVRVFRSRPRQDSSTG
jgi:hypothetical protein